MRRPHYPIIISIHSPRMGRDFFKPGTEERLVISIHSPRMGRDRACQKARHIAKQDFNPLSPHGERPGGNGGLLVRRISIHSPRMGRDDTVAAKVATVNGISIHSPRMGRDPHKGSRRATAQPFQSTLPAWGETRWRWDADGYDQISIHSPRMGRDQSLMTPQTTRHRFQSTLPAWGETQASSVLEGIQSHFNPLSPHGERPF